MGKVEGIGLRAKSMEFRAKGIGFIFLVLCSLLLYGCGKVGPPADHYHTILDMEEQGEQIRRDTGRRPDEVVVPDADPKPIKVADASVQQETPDEPQSETEETPVVGQEERTQEKPPQREIVHEPSPPQEPEPIAVASDVIKSALNSSDLGISVRTVELVDGRLSGGRNSVRIYFLPGSVDVIGDKFGAICAVLYYLDSEAKTVDTIAGIAEDEQANLLAVLQSSMSDITAWMTKEITKVEWYARITKKIL